ncbi:glucose-1-phosphate thymidylyltransferase RfbA [Streptomyces albidoflavus]|uniref:glucose-1-phosphate thymidylyltransferase RfbA n=1 Tax=Streptomyces TaxID=1883 RepID=UPI00101E386E|nr:MULTISPECIES: glucose-1-phosphate thymidylyltransferase RfbA [Streptomyces]RZD87874.1 glucose-1-phosphate thymidylyltransferase [Streptomyces albidoflavus]RZE03349.1 glucose-1-phosphate thymidylyltransferase [Streptomyces albidoflavus]RZE11793.1 glucose-1-phosphate thymidylyltransferase [Streptomyces albidoflavus]RZE65907.1 glucose-1-phosphate thymidylyltransferase [Streptomyces albidoflavus]
MRGILLAGGSGSRLLPLTTTNSKQLLPVYDKPLVYYPLSVLMLAGMREILIITRSQHLDSFHDLLGDGSHLGLDIRYAAQNEPRGIAEALVIGREFAGDEDICLILGDNIFYGHGLPATLREAAAAVDGCTVFGYPVSDPERYGVAVLDGEGALTDIEEKPAAPSSNLAVTGLYLYSNDALGHVEQISPSARGELEITDVNRLLIKEGRARLVRLGRGVAWLDAGTHDSLLEASQYVQVLQKRQGMQIACLEETAFHMGYIGMGQLGKLAEGLSPGSEYGKHVRSLVRA